MSTQSETLRVPKLRFPEFSGDWIIMKLGETDVSLKRGPFGSSLKKSMFVNEDEDTYKIYEQKHAIQNNLDIGNYHITSKDFDTLKGFEVTNGDYLMSCSGTIGKMVKVRGSFKKGIINQALLRIRLGKDFDESFFLYAFIKNINQLETKGSGIKNLGSLKFLRNEFLTPIPAKPEQQKIATFLTLVDTKIEKLTKKLELLGEYKKGLMKKIFSQEIRFKADDGSDYPDWEEKKLGDIVNFENGKGHEQNISLDGKFIVVNSKFISSEGKVKKYTNAQKSPLNFSDVVMVMSDIPNGKALAKCYYIEQDNLYSLNQRICGLKHKYADNKFIFYRINRHKYFLSFDSKVGQTNLKKKDIIECPIYIPIDLEEQQKIANFLSSIDSKIEQIGKQLDESKQFKKALLQQMLV